MNFENTLLGIAIVTSLIVAIQLVLTLIGMDSMDGAEMEMDFDADGDGEIDSESGHSSFQLLTFRNMVTFLAVFSWITLGCMDGGYSQTTSMLWGGLAGSISMFFMALIVYGMHKLKEENIPTMEKTIGKKATVYLGIPKKGEGKGKVTITVNGSSKTVTAYSQGPKFSTNSRVEVVGVEGEELIVDEISNQ